MWHLEIPAVEKHSSLLVSWIEPRLTFTKPYLFFSGDSSSQQHLSHTNVLVLQEPGSGGSVSGGRCCRSGGEDQTAHRERPREQRGLGHSKRICEWTTSQGWKLPVLQVQGWIIIYSTFPSSFESQKKPQVNSICTKLEKDGRWKKKKTDREIVLFLFAFFSDGPHAFCQQSRMRVPQWEWWLWLW